MINSYEITSDSIEGKIFSMRRYKLCIWCEGNWKIFWLRNPKNVLKHRCRSYDEPGHMIQWNFTIMTMVLVDFVIILNEIIGMLWKEYT